MKHLLVVAVIIGCLLILGCTKKYGEKISYDCFDVFSSNGATREDAQNMGDYFQNLGLSDTGDDRKSMQLQKPAGNYLVKFGAVDEADSDPEMIESFEFIGYVLSALVYYNTRVDIYLCDDSFNTKKELRFAEHSGRMDAYIAAEDDLV